MLHVYHAPAERVALKRQIFTIASQLVSTTDFNNDFSHVEFPTKSSYVVPLGYREKQITTLDELYQRYTK